MIRNADSGGARVIALGTFDGVHRGHRRLIRAARSLAREAGVPLRVCTFDRHPLEILRPENPPELLSTTPEKAAQMCALGVDEMELMPFDRNMADMEPEAFLEGLRSRMEIRAVVAGWNYSFGRKGRGNAALLEADGEAFGYRALIVPPETLADGTAISSSLIRQKLKEGLVGDADDLLGYEYSLTGTVAQGKHQGRKLGFPTANIEPWRRKALPRFGVYTCLMETDAETLPAVCNIGLQPTLPSGKVTVEAHALQETPVLYGRKVRLTPLKMLREERRFETPEQLAAQIEKDREDALRLFGMA